MTFVDRGVLLKAIQSHWESVKYVGHDQPCCKYSRDRLRALSSFAHAVCKFQFCKFASAKLILRKRAGLNERRRPSCQTEHPRIFNEYGCAHTQAEGFSFHYRLLLRAAPRCFRSYRPARTCFATFYRRRYRVFRKNQILKTSLFLRFLRIVKVTNSI